MSRIALVDPSTLTDNAAEQYYRFPTNLTRALLRTRGCTQACLDLGAALRNTNLDAKSYELIILRVAALSRSQYERMQHLEPARQSGWTDQEIAAIEAGDESCFGPRFAALLAYVDDCLHSVRASSQTFSRICEHFSESAVADATLLIGFYMMTARFLESLDVDLDDAPSSVLLNR
ncbi:carboxymuconolactone decarboxylase family protein [Sinorhizobium meliloti]|uniref:carboxymuconolactone decarboxylase family protein n=1 Tax=Rhizobium meliloti TaxID=382 RepID=UPI000FDC87F7|nr:carboxymuconolactone decarboxylase family protein [Sinorhizobium meliloti]RVQ47552.1 carboxymuconolactone decarboxylase family protein [Sinorhizobium meliloti]